MRDVTYRAGRNDIAAEQMARGRAHQSKIPDNLVGALLEVQAGQARTDAAVADLAKIVTQLTATWKDKAVTQIGVIALAVISIIGGQRALAPTPPAPQVTIYKSELQTQADGCAKAANGSDSAYVQCMAAQVVAPNAPSVTSEQRR